MQRTILVYSNCKNRSAKGDYTFGGNIAVDLKREAMEQQIDIDVILVSTRAGIDRFFSLYGKPDANQRVNITGVDVGLSALEDFDGTGCNVIGFIDANVCKSASSELIKNVISPECKFLYIGNANQYDWSELGYQMMVLSESYEDQPGLLKLFSFFDVLIASAGYGLGRLGMPVTAKLDKLPELSGTELHLVPNQKYGVIYFNSRGYQNNDLVLQYVELTNLPQYLVIGDVSHRQHDIEHACKLEMQQNSAGSSSESVTFLPSLPNHVMRRISANSTDQLVATTGVNAALEVMTDGKLPYYEFLISNKSFVTSFLDLVKSLAMQQCSARDFRAVVDLAVLLFAQKPLSTIDLRRTKVMLSDTTTCAKLAALNQEVIASASGKLSTRLLNFITSPRATTLDDLTYEVSKSLQSKSDKVRPAIGKALRRAAATNKLFELKVLIKNILANPAAGFSLDDQDDVRHFTALHWAVTAFNKDAVKLLIQAGANTDINDKQNRKPLDIALVNGTKEIIRLLVEAGARVGVDVDVVEKYGDELGRYYNDCVASRFKSVTSLGNSRIH